MIGRKLPEVTFKTRVRDESIGGPNPYRWQDKTTADYFEGKRVILFSLPGAFTPTCSTYQLPDFEKLFDSFRAQGIDAIYCVAVNDAFVMNAWGRQQGVDKVTLIPDGSGEFTRKMGMLVAKDNLGFGLRSWRYAAIVDDGLVETWFEEPGFSDKEHTRHDHGRTRRPARGLSFTLDRRRTRDRPAFRRAVSRFPGDAGQPLTQTCRKRRSEPTSTKAVSLPP
jgi:peroxiredoxin